MFHLIFSPSLGRLTHHLCSSLESRDVFKSPLTGPTLALGDTSMAPALRSAISHHFGIASGLKIVSAHEIFALLAVKHNPRLKIVNHSSLTLLIAAALSDDNFLSHDDVSEIRRYLGPSNLDQHSQKKMQLANMLAQNFYRYSFYRPSMLDDWTTRSKKNPSEAKNGAEKWQSHFYRHVFGDDDGGYLTPNGERAHLALRALRLSTLPADGPFFFFGHTHIAPGVLQAIEKVTQSSELFLWMINPCTEYWEDTRAFGADDNLLLARMGEAGRSSVKLASELAGHDFVWADEAPEAPVTSHLQHLQRDVRLRIGPEDSAPHATLELGDGSVVISSYAKKRDEVQALARTLTAALEADTSLTLADFCILTPPDSYESYRALVPAAFADHGDFEFYFASGHAVDESPVLQCMMAMIDLPLSECTRSSILNVLTHPFVSARFSDVDTDAWAEMAARLGIYFGSDTRDHEGTYIHSDLFNWDQGIKRLALGMLSSGGEDTSAPFQVAEHEFLPERVSEEQRESAAHFGSAARSLLADVEFCAQAKMPLQAWSEMWVSFVDAYLQAPADQDERPLIRLKRRLRDMAKGDLIGRDLNAREAREIALRAFESEGVPQQKLKRGIFMAPLSMSRPLQFRHSFLLGLGDDFPKHTDVDALDLSGLEFCLGDLSRADQDRYAFLLALQGTRDTLHLSHLEVDAGSGAVLSPSALILETKEALMRRGLLARPQVSSELSQPFQSALAQRQERAASTRARIEAKCADEQKRPPPTEDILDWAGIVVPRVPRVSAAEPGVVSLTLGQLRSFLEEPIQAWSKTVLGMRPQAERLELHASEEPLAMSRLDESVLLRTVFSQCLASKLKLESAYERALHTLMLSGKVPLGIFGEALRQHHLETLNRWQEQIFGESFAHVSFGRAMHAAAGDTRLDTLHIQAPGSPTLSGRIGPTSDFGADTGALVALSEKKAKDRRVQLRALVDYVVLCALGQGEGISKILILAENKVETLGVTPLTQSNAADLITKWVTSLLEESHDYFFNYKVAFSALRKKPILALEALEKEQTQAARSGSFGAIEDAASFPFPDDVDALIESRYAPLLNLVEGGV